MSLKYEPSSEPWHIYVRYLFLVEKEQTMLELRETVAILETKVGLRMLVYLVICDSG